jgi:hypothetical protein
MTDDDIFYYLEDLVLRSGGILIGNPGSFTEHKVKSIKIHKIIKSYDGFYNVEFSMEVHKSVDGFIPNDKWVSTSIKVNTRDIKVQRDVKLNILLKNPDK